jgi:hypothetical protein
LLISIHGVLTSGVGAPTAAVLWPMIVSGANGSVGKTVWSFAAPPPRAAGLVQRTSSAGSAERPKIAPGGTAALKAEKAITQPIWLAVRQAPMCLKSPPIFLPLATWTLPPSRIAEISFLRTRGFVSICSLTSFLRW